MRFTGIVVGFSCLFMLFHYAATRPVGPLIKLPPAVYGYGMILAVFGTVAPTLLLSHGLKRAAAHKFAVISAIGPVFWPLDSRSCHQPLSGILESLAQCRGRLVGLSRSAIFVCYSA
jgi:drug/metabolite transporter (DMT)-like permease